jgi:hypothetical protein
MRSVALVLLVALSALSQARNPMPGWMAPSGGSSAAIHDSLDAAIRSGDQSIRVDSIRANWISGGVTCDSACQSTIGGGEGVLYKDALSAITSLPPGSVGQILQSRGEGLPPEFTNPASINAFVYGPGSDLVSNPQPINPNAKYVRVTDTMRIVAGSGFASNPALPDGNSRYVAVDDVWGITGYEAVTPPASVNFRGVAYGQGWYVLVATNGEVYIGTKIDSLNLVYTAGAALNDVIYDDYTGKFLAVGASGTMIRSFNGWSWGTVSLPVDVATDNLTGIASNGTGNFAVSNGSSGPRGLVSLDGGDNWSLVNTSGATQTVSYTGTWFVAGRSSGGAGAFGYVNANSPSGIVWSNATLTGSSGNVQSIINDGVNLIAATANGDIGICPATSTPSAGNWTLVRVGDGGAIRLFVANGYVFAFGSNGVSLMSTDHGVTWKAGPPVGTTDFMRAGMSDPLSSGAILVGDNGTIQYGNGPFTYTAGVSAAARANGIAYGAGLYVRVGNGGMVETSPDLTTWTSRTSGTVQDLSFVAWIDRLNTFAALGASNTILLSTDGVNWTPATTSPTAATWSSLADNGGVVCITGTLGNTLTTEDFSSYTAGSFFGTTGQGSSVVWTGSRFVAGVRAFDATNAVVQTSVDGNTWSRVDIPHGKGSSTPIEMMLWTGTTTVAVGANGFIATAGANGTTWTVRTSGTTQSLRILMKDAILYVFGGNGASRQSTDNGVTWTAAPPVGTADFMRAGMSDPLSKRVILVGDNGTMRLGIGSLSISAYTTASSRNSRTSPVASQFMQYSDLPDEIDFAGEVSFDLAALTSTDVPLNIDVLRQFKSTAYASTVDRTDDTNPLGHTFDTYSETPLVVTIPSQLTFQIGVLTPGDVPFDFDVYTINDLIYITAIVQNASLSPGPYYCYNCVYDFGPDQRFEFGPESAGQYATLFIQNSTTGEMFVRKSVGTGDAGDPITWNDAIVFNADGSVKIPGLSGTGTRAVMVDEDGNLSAP